MSFRKIRPSTGDIPRHNTPEHAAASDPRRVRDGKAVDTGNATTTKRRRVPDSVTRNACLNCKKARAKCDGMKPCKRCATRIETADCVYEVHIKHAKEELVKQIKHLMAKEHLTEQILQALSTDEQIPGIIARLKNAETYESIVSWLGRSPIENLDGLSPRGSQLSLIDASDNDRASMAGPFSWTTVTSDSSVLDHLFQLYFAWVHPIHTLFSEGHFVDSYKGQSDVYCSSVLVNAICAMACHFHSASDTDDIDYEELGREFAEVVRTNIDGDDLSITTVQTFTVMFLIGAARRDGLRASTYLKTATSNISRVSYLDVDGFQEVLRSTVRGIQSLNGEWSQVTFQVPPAMRIEYYEGLEDRHDKLDDAQWYFYRFANEEYRCWPGLLATTNRHRSKLVRIISEVTTMMYAPNSPPLTAHLVLQYYRRYMVWRRELPDSIGSIEHSRGPALPHVLSLHILYENAVVHLLRPLLDYNGFPTSTIERTIWIHAQNGLFLYDQHYRGVYTCRYQSVLQIFSLLHLTDVVARFFPDGMGGSGKYGIEAIRLALDALVEVRGGFTVSGPLREMLRRTASECSISLETDTTGHVGSSRRPSNARIYRLDDMIDTCTRHSYVQPVGEIHNKYSPSFSADWMAQCADFGFSDSPSGTRTLGGSSADERGAQSLMKIRNLLNTN